MKKIIFAILAFLTLASAGHANEECARYLSYSVTDVGSLGPGWNDLSLSRYYSSGSKYGGWFGTGWGSTFETRLQINPDGTLVMFEDGINSPTVFHPPGFTPEVMSAELARIIKSDGWRLSYEMGPPDSPEFNRNIEENEELRHRTYAYLVNNSLVEPKILPEGTIYEYQHGCLRGEIVVSSDGYKYTRGEEELYFDRKGRLVRIRRENEADISIRILESKIHLINDKGVQIVLDYNEDHRVTHIETPGKDLVYNYSRDLPVSVVSKGEVLSYYIHDENRRLTVYDDHENMARQISYHGDSFEKDIVVDLADGRRVKTAVSPLPSGLGNMVVKTVSGGSRGGYLDDTTVLSECTYARQRNDFGYLWLSRKQCVINGRLTTTTYNPAGLPLSIARGEQTTNFTYNDEGFLLRKEKSNGGVIELSYDERFWKITRVSKYSPGSQDRPPAISTFQYDERGNLIRATSPKGDELVLAYNEQEGIASMEHVGNTTLEFTYNEFGKPTVISVKGGSSVMVTYDDQGEIEDVTSDGGHAVALKITRAFQKLLSIVKPAGVNLRM